MTDIENHPPISRASFLRQLALFGLLLSGLPARALALPFSARRREFKHPEPRPGITGENVLSDEKLPKKRGVREAYAAARAYPAIFDGLYCACRCEHSHGHRSLLACFESDQPTGCWGCQEEAELVAKLAKQGKTLAEIRAAVDEELG
ncbi:MAG TPA: PCYCGC motif-containing (lipo)protein [Gemmatimonadaceae bacterium]|nr:PCYCGC motif-containing (lipo)protein [Gemmatimonadaceae bacterium]